MPILENPQHELVAQKVASGDTITAAYLSVYGGTEKAAAAHGSRLVGKGKMAERILDLQTELAAETFIKKKHLIAKCWTIFTTPIAGITENHELAQEVKKERQVRGRGEDAEEFEVLTIKVPCKLAALQTIAKLTGMYAPEKAEVTVRGVAAIGVKQFLDKRRAKRRAKV